jgi:hypothetical protein
MGSPAVSPVTPAKAGARRLAVLPALLALLALTTHLAVNLFSPYGFHRDEFLYLAMGRHLRLWSMDFPPFIALAAKATLATLGSSLIAIRFLPAVTSALLVLLAAMIARRLGGGSYAQATAALAVALSPLFLRAGNLFQPVVFDQLWWTLALYSVLAIGDGRAARRLDGSAARPLDPRLSTTRRSWLLLGLWLGLGLLTKFSIAFIGIGIVAAVLITPARRWLLTPWPWLALVVALAIGSPSIVGQLRLHFPVVGQMHDLQSSQLDRISPLAFLKGQLDMFGPLILLAMLGLIHLLRGRHAIAGWAILATFVLLVFLKGKAYYVGPIYPTLFAAGAVCLEQIAVARASRVARTLWHGIPILVIVAFGAIAFPLGVPILPPAQMDAYARKIGVTSTTNTGETIALPQDYADMLGWEEQVDSTAKVFHSLSAEEQQEAVILGTSYGRAGANDQLGPRLGLPPAVSPVGSYWYFGPGKKPGKVVIVIGGTREDLAPYFDSVTLAAHVSNPWRVPRERELDIWVARGNHHTLQEIWEGFRGMN